MEEPLSLLAVSSSSSSAGGLVPPRRRRRHGVCHESGVPLPAALRLLQDLASPTVFRGSSYNVATAATSLQRRNAFRKISAPVRAAAQQLPDSLQSYPCPPSPPLSMASTGYSFGQLSSHRVALRRRQRRSSATATTDNVDRTLFVNDDEFSRDALALAMSNQTKRSSYNGNSSLNKDSTKGQTVTKWKMDTSTSFNACPSTIRRRLSYPVGPRLGIRHCCRSRRWRRRSTSAAAAFWILPRSSRHSLVPYLYTCIHIFLFMYFLYI
jgi:hypothetical protein